MKVPYSWLKEYVNSDITAEELEEKLFGCGFEVEELIDLGKRSAVLLWVRCSAVNPWKARICSSAR